MAAQAWKINYEAKKKIGNSTLNLASTAYRISLYKSSSNFATGSLSVYSELTNEVASGNGYSSSGKALTGEVWTVGANASTYKFDVDDPIWTATGGNITSIMGAVIWNSSTGTFILCRASLTSSVFTLSSGNTLTLQMNSSGVFTMV
jgi:hypothetical protein